MKMADFRHIRMAHDVGRSIMTCARSGLLAGLIALGCVASAGAAEQHNIIAEKDVKWGAAPGSLPAGAQASVLLGDPSKEGLFVLRLKLPKGYHIPPHTHPKPEVVTVVSGALGLGMGDKADPSRATAISTGGFFAMQPGETHFAYANEETVLQLSSTGPWGISYANPKDDPRNK